MKLNKLKLKNFYKFTDFEIVFNGRITKLIGMNGAGKSSILLALWAGLKGIAERGKAGQLIGERFRFIGNNGKSADIEIEFVDEVKNITITAKNHITTSGNQLSFTSSEGGTIDEAWIKSFFNVAFLSASHFIKLSSKEQALALGINTYQFDKNIAKLKEECTLINRDLKKIGAIEPVEKVEPVDVSELMRERKEKEKYNQTQNEYQEAIDLHYEDIDDCNEEITELEVQITEAQKGIRQHKKAIEGIKGIIKELPKSSDKEPLDCIDNLIKESQSINDKAKNYKDYLQSVKESDKIKAQLEENKNLQSVENQSRVEYIKQKKLPFTDLSIDDKGGLMLKNRPISSPYFSKGELEIIVAKLYSSLFGDDDDALKMRFIDDFELLDEGNQKRLIDDLLGKGFQIIATEVGNKSKENSILLRECKIVKDETEEPKIF